MTIDRAIEILDPNHREHYDGLEEVNEACRMGMEALKRQRWIPVSERLPESGTECNVVWVNHDPEPYYAEIKNVPFSATAVYFRGRWYWFSATCLDILSEYGDNETDKMNDCIEITHWMPLPEPPEEGGARSEEK